MDSRKASLNDIEAMIARWREGAGPGWRDVFQRRQEVHRQSYEGKGNPLDAWSALLLAYAIGEPPPAWVMEYLTLCAAGFHDLQHAASQGQKIKPSAVAGVLSMVSIGAGTEFPSIGDFD